MTGRADPDALPVLLPVALRLEGRPCLVVGGGPVATHKARLLLECGAQVDVVATKISASMSELGHATPQLDATERPYRSADVLGRAFVISATGEPSVDALVAADARAAGVLVNCADDPERSDAFFTSVHRAGPVVISVSSSGASPAVASWLRRRIGRDVGPEFGRLAELVRECRRTLHERGRSTMGHDWNALLTDQLVEIVRAGDDDRARSIIADWMAAR